MLQNQTSSALSGAKIQNLLKLQQLFYNKFLTVQLLHELISLYTCCLENIDEKQIELRTYFLEKIQFVLSRSQIQPLLNSVNLTPTQKSNESNDNKMMQDLRQTLRATKRTEQLTLQNSLFTNMNKKRLVNYDGDNPGQKKKKIDIQLKLMDQMKKNIKNISHEVDIANQKHQNENRLINNITKEQNTRLEERLARRKNKKRKQSVEMIKNDESRSDSGGKEVIKEKEINLQCLKQQFFKSQNEINNTILRITLRKTQQKGHFKQEGVQIVSGNQATIKRRIKTAQRDGQD